MEEGEPHDRGKVQTRVSAPDPQSDLRRRYVAACKAWRRAVERDGPLDAPAIDFTPFSDLICGAAGKRTGRPCPQRGLYSNGRCRWHGGPSTGPKTPAGKERAMLNHKKGRGMSSEALECSEIAARVDPAPLGVAVAEAHEAADIPLLSASVGGAIDQAERAADPLITPRPPKGAPAEAAAYPMTAPRSPEVSRRNGRPLQGVRDCLAARPGRPMTPDRIAAITKLDVGRIESALRLLVLMRQVEHCAEAAGPVGYKLSRPTR